VLREDSIHGDIILDDLSNRGFVMSLDVAGCVSLSHWKVRGVMREARACIAEVPLMTLHASGVVHTWSRMYLESGPYHQIYEFSQHGAEGSKQGVVG
jgi:hypothetical protein